MFRSVKIVSGIYECNQAPHGNWDCKSLLQIDNRENTNNNNNRNKVPKNVKVITIVTIRYYNNNIIITIIKRFRRQLRLRFPKLLLLG